MFVIKILSLGLNSTPHYRIGNDTFAVCFSYHVESKCQWHTMLVVSVAFLLVALGTIVIVCVGHLSTWQGLQFRDGSFNDDLSGAGISTL
jgi:hypothetical protein